MDQLLTVFRRAMPTMVDELTATLIDEHIQPYASLERAQLHALAAAVLAAVEQDLETGSTTHFSAYWEHVARLRAEQGGEVTEILKGVSFGERVMDAHMRAAFADAPSCAPGGPTACTTSSTTASSCCRGSSSTPTSA